MRLSLLVLLSSACRHRGPEGPTRLESLLVLADAAWDERGRTGLAAAEGPLLQAFAEDPHHPGVLWRLARWHVAQGLVAEAPDRARAEYAEARALAVRCLDGDPVVAQRRAQQGWEAALAVLPPERSACAAWSALAWARWMVAIGGPTATLDLAPVDALLAVTIDAADPSVRGVAVWADGLVSAVRPAWAGGDPARAADRLALAVRLEPGALVRQVDLYELAVVPAGDPEAIAALRGRILGAAAEAPEDVAARDRVGR